MLLLSSADFFSVGLDLGPNCLQRFSAVDKLSLARKELKHDSAHDDQQKLSLKFPLLCPLYICTCMYKV